jgi:hypothetical protein
MALTFIPIKLRKYNGKSKAVIPCGEYYDIQRKRNHAS